MNRNEDGKFDTGRAVIGSVFLATGLAASTASAAPLAATVASTPLVVGGILVGLALLVGFTLVLIRSFRTMSSSHGEDRLEMARKEAERLAASFSARPTVDALKSLIDELREASSDDEARIYSATLSRLTGRYFGEDDLAWEVWLRRDSAHHVQHLPANVTAHSGLREREALPVSG